MDNLNFLSPLLISLKVALVSSLINIILGIGFAYFLTKLKLKTKTLLITIFTLPLVLPPTVLGYYLLVLLGKNGPLGHWLKNVFDISLIFTWQGAVIAACVVTFPLFFRTALSAFESVDPELEQAARVLGMSEYYVFFRVSLPLAWKGVFAGILLGFARALGEFGATLMVAGSIPQKTQTLSLAIYEAVQAGDEQSAFHFVLIISITCILILLIAQKLSANQEKLV